MQVLLVFISAALVNNFVLARFLGVCPFLGASGKVETAAGMGVAVTFVMTLSSAAAFVVYRFLLMPQRIADTNIFTSVLAADITYLYLVAFILIIAALTRVTELFIRKTSPALYQALGIYLPLITVNCAVLGVAVLNRDQRDFLTAVARGAGAAVGFLIVIVLFAGIRERMERSSPPPSFAGLPIALVAAGLMSVAFMGFTGLVK